MTGATAANVELGPPSLTGGEVLLAVDGLNVEYARGGTTVAAVRDVSLEVRRGEKLALVGESGCGKSTLALALLGLVDPPGRVTGGSIELNGRNIRSVDDRAMTRIRGREISLIFQDAMSALDPLKTVGAQLIDTLRRHQSGISLREARLRAEQLFAEVDLLPAAGRLDQYPHQFSGGMRQRTMIAIALANNPDVVVADEPTTALDVTTQAQVLALFQRMTADRGAAAILITHNLGVVAQFCDRVAVMYAGRIVESGPTDQVLARPAHPYTQGLIASIPQPLWPKDKPLPTIAGMPPDLKQRISGCAFEPRCPVGGGNERCRSDRPHLRGTRSGFVACHFAEGVGGTPAVGAAA